MIDAIRQFNRTAPLEFLTRFDERSLKSYLDRLSLTRGPRGRRSVWVREGDTPAVVARLRMA